jgi:hypothetical protein
MSAHVGKDSEEQDPRNMPIAGAAFHGGVVFLISGRPDGGVDRLTPDQARALAAELEDAADEAEDRAS